MMLLRGFWHARRWPWTTAVLLVVMSQASSAFGQAETLPDASDVESSASESDDESEPSPHSVPPLDEPMDDEFTFDEDEVSAEELMEEFFGPPKELTPIETALMIAFYAVILGILIAIKVTLLWVLRGFVLALPPEYRHFQPNHVWFALIPCFDLVWNFIMCSGISQSYRAYFQAQNRLDVGDCGQSIGMLLCSCVTATALTGAIPCIGMCIAPLTGIATLIFLIVYFVQLSGLKAQITPWQAEAKW